MGGLCETHIDPYGYIEGAGLYESPEVQRLKQTGDIFGTLMGYLNHVEAGGATAFCQPFHEEIIRYGTCGLSFMHGSSHIRSVLIGNRLSKLPSNFGCFAILLRQIQSKHSGL